MDLAARTALARALLADDAIPALIAQVFFARHPEWQTRFGALGRRRCTEDARFHLSFLAGAVQAGSPELFADYVRWCADMLAARQIDRAHLAEHLDLVEEHLELERGLGDFVGEFLDAARTAIAGPTTIAEEAADERTPLRLAYLAAALAGKRGEAWQVTREARRKGLSIEGIYRDLVLWTQRRLGELWAGAKITVAAEHMASAVTQSVIGRLYAEIPGDRPAGRTLMAGVEGELHVLPAQIASDLLEIDGWDVAFVGTNATDASVLAAIAAQKADVLGLSVTMAFNLPRTVALARAARERFTTLPIVIGGRAVRGAGALATELGVDIDAEGSGIALRGYRVGSPR